MENSNVDCLDLGVIQSNLLDMATFQVRHPVTGKVTGATIQLYGPDSEMAQQLDVKLSDKRLQRIQQRGVQKISSQELSELTLEKLVGMTKEISNFFSNGEPYESTRSNIYALYQKNAWLREQVQDFLEDRHNFFKDS